MRILLQLNLERKDAYFTFHAVVFVSFLRYCLARPAVNLKTNSSALNHHWLAANRGDGGIVFAHWADNFCGAAFFGMANDYIVNVKTLIVATVFFMPEPFQITAAQKGKTETQK